MRHRRSLTALAGIAIVAAACSGGGAPSASSPGSNATASTAASAAPTTAASATASSAPSTEASTAPSASAAGSVGEGEGALNLVAWAGYVVGGTGGEQVEGYDWVKDFETATGCKVTVKVGGGSSEMVQLMKTGQYDGVSASGDATLRLIAGGDVAPVDLSLVPNYANVFEGLKNSRTTPLAARPTACPMVAAPTC